MRVSQLWTVTFFKPHINVTMCALFCTFLSNTTFFKQFSHHFRRFLNYFCNSYITRNDSHIVNCCWTIYLSDIDTVSDGNFPYSFIINYSMNCVTFHAKISGAQELVHLNTSHRLHSVWNIRYVTYP